MPRVPLSQQTRPATRDDPKVTAARALQRFAGNAATARLLQRQAVAAPVRPPQTWESWTEAEIRAIQRELKRLRLYDLRVDGDLGPRTEQGLTEAFGGDAWRSLTAAIATERLAAASRPRDGGGHDLRYAELFRDGVFDVTFGIGYMEGANAEGTTTPWEMANVDHNVTEALTARGFREDGDRAAELLAAAGRAVDDAGYGRWFVKENATTYTPVAGASRNIHAIVRVVMNTVEGGGGRARDAFLEAMTRGDAAYYTGHGRYGTGPDFDRNFLQFRVYDEHGNLTQTIDDYEVLERLLRRHGDPWTVFQRWRRNGRLQVDLSNAGNVRMRASSPHQNEFGGRLINWALQETGSQPVTGAGGALDTGTKRYRLLAFDGCRTSDYERALRGTTGYDSRGADVIETNRTVSGGAEAPTFMAFLDSVLAQRSGERLVGGMNAAMRAGEPEFSGNPFVMTGLGDNPGH